MTPLVLFGCLCVSFWSTMLGSPISCPQECSRCNHDNQGQLTKVICTDIVIPSLPETVQHIQISDAVSSQILPMGQLKAFIFTKRITLETLIIQNYKIKTIEDGCFENNINLRTLDLSKNMITSLSTDAFDGLTNLTYLNLNQNRMQTLNGSVFQYLTGLKELHIAVNLFENIGKQDFLGLDNLMKLDMQSNNIVYIHPSAFELAPSLQDINLQHNQLTVIEAEVFQGLNSLQVINLQNNEIISLQPGCMSSNSLVMVNLAQNNLSEIPTKFLVSVANKNLEVNLARNIITKIKVSDLKAVQLKTLYLVSNEIWKIEREAFNNTEIDTIDLEQNHLANLPITVWRYLNTSHVIRLGNNPWTCDCNIQWLAVLMTTLTISSQEPVCAQPTQFFGRKLTEVVDELSSGCKDFSDLLNFLDIPPRQSLVTPELRKTVPPTYPLVTPRLRSTRRSSTTVSTKTTTTVTTATRSSSPPLQSTTNPTSLSMSNRPNVDETKIPIVIGVCVSVGIILCVIIASIIIYRVMHSRVAIDTELSVECRKPDTNFKPRIRTSWIDAVT